MAYDLVIRGGRMVDPSQGIDAVLDLGIRGPRIVALGPTLAGVGSDGSAARATVDAAGAIVTPGLVDLHTHVWWGVAPLGVEADPNNLARGVTTAVDAGSSGASTFPAFRRYVIDVSATRVVAMLHISQIGMAQDSGAPGESVGELEDIRWARVDRAIDIARAHADVIVGIKVRLSVPMVGPDPEQCREAMRRTRQAADAVGKPCMVHVGGTAIGIDELLSMLRAGDVVTHCFHGRDEGILDEAGRIRRSVRDAIDRGVIFDVGHGAGSFNYDVARRALDAGLQPGTISSDIHAWNIAGPVYDLATTASKFLHLGLPLTSVIQKVTQAPAAAIGLGGQIGTLAPGACADASILRLAEGEWPFTDSHGVTEIGRRRLEPVAVVRAGRVHPCAPSVFRSSPLGGPATRTLDAYPHDHSGHPRDHADGHPHIHHGQTH
ncbi:MAG: amidohydrolase/deacetylase family metallohydrolase [Chloroflexota bacterium]|nr:MAG: amidohydrolase/deacetylase family metallohydrolase [Chloroflexota bacterium]